MKEGAVPEKEKLAAFAFALHLMTSTHFQDNYIIVTLSNTIKNILIYTLLQLTSLVCFLVAACNHNTLKECDLLTEERELVVAAADD